MSFKIRSRVVESVTFGPSPQTEEWYWILLTRAEAEALKRGKVTEYTRVQVEAMLRKWPIDEET